jgi:hypothetical protein
MPDDDGRAVGQPHTMSETLVRLLDDESVDAMTYTLACALALSTIELAERDVWDDDARLCTVMRVEDAEDDLLGLSVGQLHLPPLPGETHPIAYIEMLCSIMRDESEIVHMPHADIVAWLFVTEAWMLSTANRDVAKRDQYEAAAAAREMHKHPDRVECRIVVMTDRAGRTYQTITERGGGEPWLLVSGTGQVSEENEAAVLDGRVTKALRRLMDLTPVGS